MYNYKGFESFNGSFEKERCHFNLAVSRGRVEENETEKEAAKREVFEETNIVCNPVKKLGERIHPETGKKIIYWICDYVEGEINVEDEDISKAKWVKIKDAPKMITSDLYPPLKEYLEEALHASEE